MGTEVKELVLGVDVPSAIAPEGRPSFSGSPFSRSNLRWLGGEAILLSEEPCCSDEVWVVVVVVVVCHGRLEEERRECWVAGAVGAGQLAEAVAPQS